MLIAVLASKPELDGIVPGTFELSPSVAVVETDNSAIVHFQKINEPEELVECILRSNCEAIVCGPHIGKTCFDPIADAQITRYEGEGLTVLEAAKSAELSLLPMLTDFEGGLGCTPGGGDCSERHQHI